MSSARNPKKAEPEQDKRQLTDLPNNVLKTILNSCSPVDITSCSLVNKKFRELIEDMEDVKSESIRSCQRAKIFVCDRRRAILEGVSTMTPTRLPRTPKHSESSGSGSSSASSIASTSCSSSESGIDGKKTKNTQTAPQPRPQPQQNQAQNTHVRRTQRERNISDRSKQTSNSSGSNTSIPTNFIADQYCDASNPNWAFAFNFDQWLQEYDVRDIHLKNFCSFFERERCEDPKNPGVFKGRTAIYETRLATQTRPHRPTSFPYSGIAELPAHEIAEVQLQSAGRIERLAESLAGVHDAHWTFKDSVCYGYRHPATIFYFLSLVRNSVRSLTFDHVKTCEKIPLDQYISLANLHRLTVNQSEQGKELCLSVKGQLLLNWLHLDDDVRKRISVHLSGCKDFRPTHLMKFVQEWLQTPKPRLFKQIAIDGGSYKYNDFMDAIELLAQRRPPRSPVNRSFGNEPNAHVVALERVCRISHPNDRSIFVLFKYCKTSRRMVLTIDVDVRPLSKLHAIALAPASAFARLTRPQSAAAVLTSPIRKLSSQKNQMDAQIPTYGHKQTRPHSHGAVQMGCRENAGSSGSGMFTRLVSFLGTSS